MHVFCAFIVDYKRELREKRNVTVGYMSTDVNVQLGVPSKLH